MIFGKEFLGWNVRWIPGFAGTNEIEMAFRIGEDTDNLMKQVLAAPPEAVEYAKSLQIKFGIIAK